MLHFDKTLQQAQLVHLIPSSKVQAACNASLIRAVTGDCLPLNLCFFIRKQR